MPLSGLPKRHGFLGMPSTALGRVSGALLGLDVLIIIVTTALFDAPNQIGPAWIGTILRLTLGVSVMAGLVTGVVAIAGKRERSWLAWLATTIPAFVLVNEIVQRFVG